MYQQITAKFKALFEQEPMVVRSPGRVNLIGEHTDYNEGFVLPAAINKEIYFAIALNGTHSCRVHSLDMEEDEVFSLAKICRRDSGWINYLLGVVAQFQQAQLPVRGFDLVFGGNVPIGAGLSSSAAVACGLAFALNRLQGFNLEKRQLVRMAQQTEHTYAGVLCGIMDQFANMYGRENHVLKLDCRSLQYDYYPLDMDGCRIVLCDTRVKHSLASSAYNTRRKECEAGVAVLQRHYPQVRSLRDATLAMLESHLQELDPVVYRRCRYVVEENARVEEGCRALQQGDLKSFGEKMYASHQGLQHAYEVSCPELDFLVSQAQTYPAVLGARMMGGGFGGCTINLVRVKGLDAFIRQMEQAYLQQFGVALHTYIAEIVGGTSLVVSDQLVAIDL